MIRLALLAATIVILCTGCKPSTAQELDQASKYDKDRYIIEYTLNTDIYSHAIEEILLVDGGDIDDVKQVVNEYTDILSDDLIEILISRGVVYDESIVDFSDEESEQFIQNGEDEIYDPRDNTYIHDGIEIDSTGEVDEQPLYSITGMDAYSDKLIASVAYKYGGPMKLWVGLDADGKITGYRVYR